MKVLVTGGAGFIGSNLVGELLSQGNEVIVIDNLSSGKEKNLAKHKNNPNLKVHIKSICDDLSGLFNGVEIVYHLAALPRVQFSIKHPAEASKVNVDGTLNVLEMCRKAGIKRVVYASSSAIYGEQDTILSVETMKPNPLSPYAHHKLTSEEHCKEYFNKYGIETISLRYFNVYGPRQDPYEGYALLIPKSIGLVKQGESPVINGDGEQTRDFIFVKDVVEAAILAGTTKNKACFGSTFNIGYGKDVSVNYVVKSIISNKGIKAVHADPVTEPRNTLADISKAKEILGWTPKYSFEDGLKETIEWFKEN